MAVGAAAVIVVAASVLLYRRRRRRERSAASKKGECAQDGVGDKDDELSTALSKPPQSSGNGSQQQSPEEATDRAYEDKFLRRGSLSVPSRKGRS
eukprot:858688-Prymnesium_polylepis.1